MDGGSNQPICNDTENNDGGNIDDISVIEEYDSDDEDDYDTLNKNTLQKLKSNNPAVCTLAIDLNKYYLQEEPFFYSIDWKENGNCISDNTQLKKLRLNSAIIEEGCDLPTRQQIQDFFACIHRNTSIKHISFSSISINDEYGGGLIQGLSGHPSLIKIEIEDGTLGSTGCTAIEKVLKHPESKLKDLRLPNCELDDQGLVIACGGLLGNSMMKKLDLSGNTDITPVGWRALSNVLQHPNCKLVALDLYGTDLDDVSATLMGSSLCCLPSLKVLSLSANRSISSSWWLSFLRQLAQTSIESLDIGDNYIEHDGLLMLTNIDSLKSLALRNMRFSSPRGWQRFIILLQARGTQLVKLDLSYNCICNGSVADLGDLLGSMSSLKTLQIDCLVCPNGSDDITSQGWVTLFTTLQHSNLNLVKLYLESSSIDSQGMELLMQLVSRMSSLKYLDLNQNSVSPSGWRPLIEYMRSPNFALKQLHLNGNKINDNTVAAFASALVQNNTLKSLSLNNCTDTNGNDLITNRGWDAASNIICNKTSVMNTYNSNHTLQYLGFHIPDDLLSYLKLNKNKDKAEVARQKILQTHFSGDDSSNIQEFLDMELEMMPAAFTWIGRDLCGLSAMYNLMRRLPDLFDSSAKKKKPNAAKRKRGV